ncbi:MAG: hypothetical protein AB7F82_05115 [Alphaproteobacteria bacterium]
MKISGFILHLRLFAQHISQRLRRRKFRPLQSLDADTLRRIHDEACLLRQQHGVEVHELAAGEKPHLPKAASGDHSTFQP